MSINRFMENRICTKQINRVRVERGVTRYFAEERVRSYPVVLDCVFVSKIILTKVESECGGNRTDKNIQQIIDPVVSFRNLSHLHRNSQMHFPARNGAHIKQISLWSTLEFTNSEMTVEIRKK